MCPRKKRVVYFKVKTKITWKKILRSFKIAVAALSVAAICVHVYFRNITLPKIYKSVEQTVEALAAESVNNSVSDLSGLFSGGKNFFDYALDGDGYITFVAVDSVAINALMQQATAVVQNEIDKRGAVRSEMAAGSLSGFDFFSDAGPKICFKFSMTGFSECDVGSEFLTCGINQTLHRLYMTVQVKYAVKVPYETLTVKYAADFLLFENLVVGKVPESYFYLSAQSGGLMLVPR